MKKTSAVRTVKMLIGVIEVLLANSSTQSREKIDQSVVDEYAEAMKSGVKFPPLVVYEDSDGRQFLASGFHRGSAAVQAGLKWFRVEIRIGTEWDAIRHSVGANGAHGLRPTNADKRKAVVMILKRKESQKLSDARIAKDCLVSGTFVGNVRRELASSEPSIARESIEVTRNDTTYFQKKGSNGKNSKRRKEVAVAEVPENTNSVISDEGAVSEGAPVVIDASMLVRDEALVSESVLEGNKTGADVLEKVVAPGQEVQKVETFVEPNGPLCWYGKPLVKVMGKRRPFEGSEALVLVLGRKKSIMTDMLRDLCKDNGSTVLATPSAMEQWKCFNMTEKDRENAALEIGEPS